jgi:hypothetical protein
MIKLRKLSKANVLISKHRVSGAKGHSHLILMTRISRDDTVSRIEPAEVKERTTEMIDTSKTRSEEKKDEIRPNSSLAKEPRNLISCLKSSNTPSKSPKRSASFCDLKQN